MTDYIVTRIPTPRNPKFATAKPRHYVFTRATEAGAFVNARNRGLRRRALFPHWRYEVPLPASTGPKK